MGYTEKKGCAYRLNAAVREIGICRGKQGIEQHCHSEPVRTTFVGISIEFQVVYRHTVCSNLPFSRVYPREVVLLFERLPRQCALLYRNDLEFGFTMTGNSTALQIPIYLYLFIPPKLYFLAAGQNPAFIRRKGNWAGCGFSCFRVQVRLSQRHRRGFRIEVLQEDLLF